ncbi:hypothetical protein [Streptomyces fradiae]|uniref:hypothetical protein n=1 Tax=Streptomyces fradiae TaxID=1906 RepID=UPI00378C2629
MARRKGVIALVTAVAVAAASLLGLWTWWNTNLFADEAYCGDKLTWAELDSVLGTKGRISSVVKQGEEGSPQFLCEVERTSKFAGAEPMEIEVRTAVHEPDFPFQTRVWRNPGSMTYFSGETTGAVSESRGWVMLPQPCQEHVGYLVQAEMSKGKTEHTELAKMLVQAAQRVAVDAGCASDAVAPAFELGERSDASETHVRSACAIKGFAIPRNALIDGKAEPGKEMVSTSTRTWACDLSFAGTGKSEVSFSVSSDPRIVNDRLRTEAGFSDLPESKGRIDGYRRAILQCGEQSVYFGMRPNDAYSELLLERERREQYGPTMRGLFQSFLDAAGKQHGCPAVTVPAG